LFQQKVLALKNGTLQQVRCPCSDNARAKISEIRKNLKIVSIFTALKTQFPDINGQHTP